jgi:alginate O-acetyltransferase complex protein AlgI
VHIALPVGISFFTFQGMSYVIDVYRREVSGEKKPLNVALYIALFPQLVAGPIVRYITVHKEINVRKSKLDEICSGIQCFILGLAKKVLIADVLAITVNDIFISLGSGIDTPTAWLGIICYTFQIYFDFSGYSDMAIGLGRMLGFHFLENFNYPYISKSITEFWRRWHISLSTWFKEYVYIPLGGNRRGSVYLHLFIVFCATGIWHGASWVFLIWGLWHGFFLIIERCFRKVRIVIPECIGWLYTMLVVIIGWVIFRSENFGQALLFFKTLFGIYHPVSVFYSIRYFFNIRIISVLTIAVVGSTPILKRFLVFQNKNIPIKITQIVVSVFLFLLTIDFVISGSFSPFIYFRF